MDFIFDNKSNELQIFKLLLFFSGKSYLNLCKSGFSTLQSEMFSILTLIQSTERQELLRPGLFTVPYFSVRRRV